MELALKHRLKDKPGSLTPTVDDLKLLLEAARKTHLIDDAHHRMGDQVRRDGNRVLHGFRTNDDLAWKTLAGARGVLNCLYSRP